MSTSTQSSVIALTLATLALAGCDQQEPGDLESELDLETRSQFIVAGQAYELINVHAGKCMDVTGVSTANGANIQLYGCSGGSNQHFTFEAVGNAFMVRNVNSDKCLDIESASTSNGANLQQYTCYGGSNQLFDVVDVDGAGVVRLVASHSGQAVDGWEWATADGTNLVQWAVTGGANQNFELVPVGGGGGGGGGGGECTNVRPTGTEWDAATCDDWAAQTSECNQPWMVDNNLCNASCGRCTPDDPPPPPGGVPKFVGNITTNNQVDYGGLHFATYWDQITPENAGKWGSVQATANSGFNWSTLDAIYDYAEDNDIIFKEHTFVWGPQQPSGNISAAQVQNWMQSFCQRYPNTALIDVVNEPPPHTEPSYANALGGGTNGNWQWIVNSFQMARDACPNAVLILNDYNNIEWPNDRANFIDITNTALANGAPIDAVGAQAHGLSDGAISTAQMISNLQNLHDQTGLDVYITEYDIDTPNDAVQLQRFQEQISYFLDADYIKGVTLWGWFYGQTWIPASGLIRNGSPRPAMTWLMQTLGRPVP